MDVYYIIHNGQDLGPYTPDELVSRGITPQTMIRAEGMRSPMPAHTVQEIRILLERSSPEAAGFYAGGYASPYHVASTSYAREFLSQKAYHPKPPDYLVWSILMIFLCTPGGIGAIVYSIQVSSLYDRGDYEGACDASRKARGWVIGSVIAGVIFLLIPIVYLVIVTIWSVSIFSSMMSAIISAAGG